MYLKMEFQEENVIIPECWGTVLILLKNFQSLNCLPAEVKENEITNKIVSNHGCTYEYYYNCENWCSRDFNTFKKELRDIFDTNLAQNRCVPPEQKIFDAVAKQILQETEFNRCFHFFKKTISDRYPIKKSKEPVNSSVSDYQLNLQKL